jgi:hypothetical protein
MRIIGPPSASNSQVLRNVQLAGATTLFTGVMFTHLWDAAINYGIDPVGMVAQSFKETGGGSYRGKVKPEFYNTAGIKVRHMDLFPGVTDNDNPLAHQMFPNWQTGAEAHAQHLCAYAGVDVLSMGVLLVDPRYFYARKTSPINWCENWSDFGNGAWAPGPTYGTDLETLMRRLQA